MNDVHFSLYVQSWRGNELDISIHFLLGKVQSVKYSLLKKSIINDGNKDTFQYFSKFDPIMSQHVFPRFAAEEPVIYR